MRSRNFFIVLKDTTGMDRMIGRTFKYPKKENQSRLCMMTSSRTLHAVSVRQMEDMCKMKTRLKPQHHQLGSNDGSPNNSPGDGASVEHEPTPDAGPSRIGSFTRAEQTPIAVWSEGQLEAALRFANGLPQGSLCGVKFESVGICQKVTLTYMIHSNAKQSVDILSAENAGNSSRQLHPNKRVILTSITSGGIENTKRVLQNVGLRVPGRSVF